MYWQWRHSLDDTIISRDTEKNSFLGGRIVKILNSFILYLSYVSVNEEANWVHVDRFVGIFKLERNTTMRKITITFFISE